MALIDRLNIVARADWGATSPQSRGKRAPQIIQPWSRKGVVIHWNGPPLDSDGSEAQDRQKALGTWRYHTGNEGDQLNWSDGAYSYKVGQSGTIYEERGLLWDQFANGTDAVGANDGTDRQWYTIMVLIGEGEVPTAAAINSVKRLVLALREAGAGWRVLPHLDFKHKTCPGPHLTALARDLDGREFQDPTQPQDKVMDLTEIDKRIAALEKQLEHNTKTVNFNQRESIAELKDRMKAVEKSSKHATAARALALSNQRTLEEVSARPAATSEPAQRDDEWSAEIEARVAIAERRAANADNGMQFMLNYFRAMISRLDEAND